MMLLSRFWYVVLSLLLGVALYVVYVAVGQYNRRNVVAMNEGLASDSQTVGWALQIDARRRLDLLLPGSVDPQIRAALAAANGKEKDKIPQKAREDARKSLADIQAKFTDYKPDAIFAVDRDGRVIAQVGFDVIANNDDFELGGYPAVFDALHGYLRDDSWVWGGKIYRVVARPVEDDATQPPVGAIVAIRGVDPQFAKDLAKRTRTNVAFYTTAQKVAAAPYDGASEKLDDASFELIGADMARLGDDKPYKESGRSEVHSLGPDGLGAMYARLQGDAYDLGAGFCVMRPRVSIKGPLGFLTGADDTDKKSVSWVVLSAAVLVSALFGLLFSFLEHSMPKSELANQARRMKKGEQDYLQLPKFRAGYRPIAQDINAGIERMLERGGGAVRKPADLESILGPVPAQPAMSAFSFPMQPGEGSGVHGPASQPMPQPFRPPGSQQQQQQPGQVPHPHPSGHHHAPPGPPPPYARPGGPPGPPPPLNSNNNANQFPSPPTQPMLGGPPARPAPHAQPFPPPRPNAGLAMGPMLPPTSPYAHTTTNEPHPADAYEPTQAAQAPIGAIGAAMAAGKSEEEATMVGQVPADVLAAATGEHQKAEEGTEEWIGVYDDFIRKKRECGEPTDGLTFEKFAQTLRKNRDALMQRHGCKRVRFAVYVKEGRASLKATPIKD